MTLFQNVTQKMLGEYIEAPPMELKLVIREDEHLQQTYEHEHLPVTLRYTKTTGSIHMEGNVLITPQYDGMLERMGGEINLTGRSDDN